MATHSSVLVWRIPGMGEAGGLPSMRSHRVRHDWGDLAAAAAAAGWVRAVTGGNGGISRANKGPGLTSRMPYIRAEGHWVTQGLGASGLAWFWWTMQTFNKEWNKKEMVFLGFPGGLSGKDSACQSRRHGFDPWSGKIPYAEEQLSSYATTTEPVLCGPHSLQLGKSPGSNEDPAQHPPPSAKKIH